MDVKSPQQKLGAKVQGSTAKGEGDAADAGLLAAKCCARMSKYVRTVQDGGGIPGQGTKIRPIVPLLQSLRLVTEKQ